MHDVDVRVREEVVEVSVGGDGLTGADQSAATCVDRSGVEASTPVRRPPAVRTERRCTSAIIPAPTIAERT